jgi:hypothetical protein
MEDRLLTTGVARALDACTEPVRGSFLNQLCGQAKEECSEGVTFCELLINLL